MEKKAKTPDTENMNFFSYQLSTFKYAGRGVRMFFTYESKAFIHLAAAIVAVFLGFLFGISMVEWALISIAIGAVYAAELINTAIERFADIIHPDIHQKIADIKDMSAGAVLIVSITALVIGLVVFVPRIVAIFLSA